MYGILVIAVLSIGSIFFALTVLIVANKAWREVRDATRRRRRRDLEPRVLSWAHGDEASLLAALGGRVPSRAALEEVLLDHVQRVRGIEKARLARALDEMGFVDRYLDALKSSRWWRRATAAERLGLAGAERATEALVAALSDAVPEVRLRAAKSLGALGGVAAVGPLVGALMEPNRWSTIRVADILGGMGPTVVAELIEEYPRLNRYGRIAAVDILGRIRSLEGVPFLRDCLGDEDGDVRARACHALGTIGDTESGPAVAKALRDEAWPVRAMAAKAIGRLGWRAAIPDLCASLRDRQWWVRANAAEALRSMGEAGTSALEGMLEDEDVYARHQAVLMLQESGFLDEQVSLLAASGGPVREAAEAFVRRLARVGQVGRLRELAESYPDAKVREVLTGLLPARPEEAEA